ncbi:hypothetical protein D3C71_2173040 [compost metagenome]
MDQIVGSESSWDEAVQRDMMASLALLKDEIVKPVHKNHLIIRAMLALLKQHASVELKEPLLRLEQSLLENSI